MPPLDPASIVSSRQYYDFLCVLTLHFKHREPNGSIDGYVKFFKLILP